ncbi:MAG: zinc/iron permease [Candidatus Peregrinibacteria bacterium GW2011_GWF2_38_29]|nr:MAG: zinc/iron permease [Candidatus Peregrinibacteria bacterium GW2011_GWF2_38_29]HBB02191.1 ZIP family metal transporter [Candidatus Peregrinibacteria bacterium]
MDTIWIYAFMSVVVVSLISLIGVVTLSVKIDKLRKILIYLISFSAGALIGDAFIHLLPEVIEESGGFSTAISLYVILGIVVSFIIEKFIHWRHCHMPITTEHKHPFAWMNLFGDSIHNLIDGLIIGAAYLVSIHVGIATTIAVILHEIPQEIGDFGVLIHGGFSVKRAILLNFATALTAIFGTAVVLILGAQLEGLSLFLVPFAAGNFIYIASTDLIPELHKETTVSKSTLQLAWFMLGVCVMLLLLQLE